MSLFIERWYPWIFGAAAGVVWYRFGPSLPMDGNFLSSALTLGSILAGFLATAKAILLGMQGSQIMRDLRRSGYIRDLVAYLRSGIYASFSFSIVSLAGFFNLSGNAVYGAVWCAMAVLAAAAFYRVVQILLRVLHFADREARA